MNTNILNFIQTLSHRDHKTLSQKVLKTMSEVGELADVALPFDQAPDTSHRFVERTRILEESIDTMLCSLSVAYSLAFTHDDILQMLEAKATKWSNLQLKHSSVSFPLPFEIHITVQLRTDLSVVGIDPIEHFKLACKAIECKPVIIDLQNRVGDSVMQDVMTSSHHFGNNVTAYHYVEDLKRRLSDCGYPAVRVKIETVPWHPMAPVGDQIMPPNCYFEAHIPITLLPYQEPELRSSVVAAHVHISKNVFKLNEDGTVVIMLTVRRSTGNYVQFSEELNQLSVQLVKGGWNVGKLITEFALYDTKTSHDLTWISQ